ncbi:patatin-like phospholipase family protein [Desulfofalx alkaliphila]|uniref:patatin-like phospholipase family protein n=1 Tax=Desulfofalx alkaliphila TaxID=105483 RepID=UPI0004E0B983|nr:patatin-like phospholipase family protein [Desulfofalx alkaliphila]
MRSNKKIGLALGGGFLRGAAHIGVLRVLEKEGFKPDMVAGTSAGSIVASLYAAGWSVDRIEDMALSLSAKEVYDDDLSTLVNIGLIAAGSITGIFKLPWPFKRPLGLMKGKRLQKFLDNNLQDQEFKDLQMLLAITAVDVNCGTKVIFVHEPVRISAALDEVYLRKGRVADAVRASTAVPGLFEPKTIGNYQLIDGGLREQVPAEVLHKLGADVVLAVDVGYDGDPYTRVNSIFHVLLQTLDIIRADAIKRELSQYADLVLRPPLSKISPMDFHRIPFAIAQGEKTAREMLPEIEKLFRSS